MTSYGLGPSDAAAAAKSAVGSSCSSDYIDVSLVMTIIRLNLAIDSKPLQIPGGMKSDIAATTTAAVSPSRICGRFLNSIGALTTSESVCSESTLACLAPPCSLKQDCSPYLRSQNRHCKACIPC